MAEKYTLTFIGRSVEKLLADMDELKTVHFAMIQNRDWQLQGLQVEVKAIQNRIERIASRLEKLEDAQ
jgi:hypothetical protein